MQNIDFKNIILKELNEELFSSNNSLNSCLVDNLIRVRKEKNISQKELASLCSLQQSNISRIENKKYCPSVDEFNRIFGKLGYKVSIRIERV